MVEFVRNAVLTTRVLELLSSPTDKIEGGSHGVCFSVSRRTSLSHRISLKCANKTLGPASNIF